MLTRNKGQQLPQSNQSGFTIIESLIAILVVAILMIGLAPVIVLSVATRVQAKRVEQASQAARSYVDGVRAGTIAAPSVMTSGNLLSSVPAPTATAPNCPQSGAYCTTPPNLYCVDGSDSDQVCTNNGFGDFVIQTFGQIPTNASADAQKGYRSYRLGIRVYRADAFKAGSTLNTNGNQASFTGGTGLKTSNSPVMQMNTQIFVSNPDTYKQLCNAAGVTGC